MQALCSSKIEISLVDGNHFDDRRKFHKNRGDAVAPFAVLFVMAVEKDRVGTQPARRSQGHCRMNTVFSRFIAGRGDHAALILLPANDNGSAAQFRPLQQFDGDEKSVHITCRMDAAASAARSSSRPCFARNLASSGNALAYLGHFWAST